MKQRVRGPWSCGPMGVGHHDLLTHWKLSVEPDDLLLPDPSVATDEVARPPHTRHRARALNDAWPFDARSTILLCLLYVAPFVISWLNHT